MKTYSEKLRNPRWQKLRLQILERDNFTCCECGDDSSTLHVHHRYYISGRDPWDYPNWSLQTLCEHCHDCKKPTGNEAEKHHEEWERIIGFVFGDQLDSKGWDIGVACGMLQSEIGSEQFAEWLIEAAEKKQEEVKTQAKQKIEFLQNHNL